MVLWLRLHSQCKGPRFYPWSGNWIPYATINHPECYSEDPTEPKKKKKTRGGGIQSILVTSFSTPPTCSALLQRRFFSSTTAIAQFRSPAVFCFACLCTESSAFILVLHSLPSEHSSTGRHVTWSSLHTYLSDSAEFLATAWVLPGLGSGRSSIFGMLHSELFLSKTQGQNGSRN